MSWFKRDSSLRSSFGRRSPSKTKPLDPEACLMSFKKHYQQACVIINKTRPNVQTEASNHHQPTNPSSDDVNVVLSNLDQMVTLLIQESKTGMSVDGDGLQIGPMLDYLMTEGILDRLYSWSLHCGEYCNVMKHEQLKLYEVLLSNSGHEILVHKPILRPLLKLLASCKDCAPVDVEKRLIVLLNQLCVSLTQNTNLLEYFFSASNDQGPARFLIFSLLIPFVHREGGIGQQARDALLLCMSLSHKSESIGFYIAEQSNFCPVLATGLSGLYSRLPRKLDIIPEDWCRLSNDDIQEIPELLMFMNSLEFCNAVIQVSHQKVKEQLLEYLYQGFLLPVLGPALHQDTMGQPVAGMKSSSKFSNSVEEIETATAYLDLFVRSVTEPALMHSFLKFILTETFDGHVVIDSLIARINSHPRLSLITMSLFKTLLDINSEDVMLELVFKYLIPCNHVMVSQRCRVRDKDIYSHTTLKFLSLIPACCDLGTVNGTAITSSPSQTLNRSIHTSQSDYTLQTDYSKTRSGSISSISTSDSDNSLSRINEFKNQETFASHYLNYLRDARFCVKKCLIGCQSWSGKYDGQSVSVDNPSAKIKLNCSSNDVTCCSESRTTSFGEKEKNCESDTTKTSSESSTCRPNGLVDSHRIYSLKENELTDECGVDKINIEIDLWTILSTCKVDTLNNLERSIDKLHFFLQGNFKSVNSSPDSKEPLRRSTITSPTEFEFNRKCVSVSSNGKMRSTSCPPDETLSAMSSVKEQQKIIGVSNNNDSMHGIPDVGPFLSVLLTKLENMMHNTIYVNLQLTGLISRLAMYPQPLLRSFLLSHNIVFQPTVRSLFQVLGSLKHKLDTFASSESSFSDMLRRARSFLAAREEKRLHELSPSRRSIQENRGRGQTVIMADAAHHRGEVRRRSLTNFLFRRGTFHDEKEQSVREVELESIAEGQGYRYINKRSPDAPEEKLEWLKTKNAVLCAIVVEEFVKELASISQEHHIVDVDTFDFLSI